MRQPLTPIEKIIYNNGERLVFGKSHYLEEDIRHRSSYIFFRMIIENDLEYMRPAKKENEPVCIVDLGCGMGHGCETLSEIENAIILGVDSCRESINYANDFYSRDNISYKCRDLHDFVPGMPTYDYVLSRGVLEHVPDGIKLGLSARWSKRLLLSVPYNEPQSANPHHVLSGIHEEDFPVQNAEFFYEDLKGITYDRNHKPPKPNMILCVCSHPDLPKIGDSGISFPVPAWKP